MPSTATGNEFKIKRLREKFAVGSAERPASVAEPDWAVFTACVHEKRPLTEVSRSLGLSQNILRGTLARVEAQMVSPAIAPNRPLEDLQLSVRAQNALHRLGCTTVEDVFRLDFTGSVRQIGSKTRKEVLDRLDQSGFRHVLPDKPSVSEMSRIARSLDRVQSRVNTTFESVMREIRYLRGRLKKLGE